jgi:hypothetical protein
MRPLSHDITHLASIGINLSESNTGLDFIGRVERWPIDVNPCIVFSPIIELKAPVAAVEQVPRRSLLV